MQSPQTVWTALLSPLLALSAACSRAQDPPRGGGTAETGDEAPTDAKDRTPSDFARFERVGEGGHFDTAITTYRNADGVAVVLFGAVHIADAEHYRALNERFAGCDVLLYELVGPEDYRPRRGERGGSFVTVLQDTLKRGLQLEFQLDGIDYSAANFVHADMTPEEMADSMEERGETLFGMLFTMAMNGARATPDEDVAGMDLDLVKAFRSGQGRHKLRLMMAGSLEQLEAIAAGGDEKGTTLLEGRNEKCLEVLQREIGNGHRRIGIYYGAAHLPHMERRLVRDLGFRKVDHEWVVAWDCTPRKDPVVDREVWAQRRQCKREIGRLADAVRRWRSERDVEDGTVPTVEQLRAPGEDGAPALYDGPAEDPWGRPYEVRGYGRFPYFDVASRGEDGEAGTGDDLHSATERQVRRMQGLDRR